MKNYTDNHNSPQEFSETVPLPQALAPPGRTIMPSIYANPGKMARMNWPRTKKSVIYPIFLPFMGCPSRCVFCAQEVQTGQGKSSTQRLRTSLETMLKDLVQRREKGAKACELAFYGGTFTALPENLWNDCLDAAHKAFNSGLIIGFRCSTRPDALSVQRLRQMRKAGCNLVELGIQSFSNSALHVSGRHCDSITSMRGCQLVKSEGIKLGVQLMPGIPGGTLKTFLHDTRLGIALGANVLRFYPCIVLKNTALATSWKNQEYVPWNLQKAIIACARGWLLARAYDCEVIRIGVASQSGLDESILAGPYLADFGGRVLGIALIIACAQLKKGANLTRDLFLKLPLQSQGYYLGWRNELKPLWTKLGIRKFLWQKEEMIEISEI